MVHNDLRTGARCVVHGLEAIALANDSPTVWERRWDEDCQKGELSLGSWKWGTYDQRVSAPFLAGSTPGLEAERDTVLHVPPSDVHQEAIVVTTGHRSPGPLVLRRKSGATAGRGTGHGGLLRYIMCSEAISKLAFLSGQHTLEEALALAILRCSEGFRTSPDHCSPSIPPKAPQNLDGHIGHGDLRGPSPEYRRLPSLHQPLVGELLQVPRTEYGRVPSLLRRRSCRRSLTSRVVTQACSRDARATASRTSSSARRAPLS